MKNDNKGFSLIELIVVIAIMAILVGAIAPQVSKYIQRAREASDIQAVGTLYTAITVALADPTVESPSLPISSATTWSSVGNSAFQTEVTNTLGMTSTQFNASLKSNKYKTKVPTVTITDNGAVTVTVAGTGATLTVDSTGSKETAAGGNNNNNNNNQENNEGGN